MSDGISDGYDYNDGRGLMESKDDWRARSLTMPEKASNPERTKDGADVPEVAVGHCAYHEDFVTLRYHREQVAALTQEVATLKAELAHWNDSKRCLHESMNEVDPENFDDCSNEQLKEATEYSERCHCFVCCWTRYELARRAALATLRSELQKANEPKACPDCGRYPGERAIQIGDTSDDKSEGE